MKRIIIISWKGLIIFYLLILIFFIMESEVCKSIQTSINQHPPYKTYFEPEKSPKGSIEELYQDVFMTMLIPYIDKAVADYYEKNIGHSPNVDPWQPHVLSIERPNGYRTFLFIIKLEVDPYLGAHNSIGVDHITIQVSSGKIIVEKFEHIKSYPIPQGY